MKTLTSTLSALFIFIGASGQTVPPAEVQKPFIEVTGLAEKEVIPNEIYIAITILERTEGKDKITVEQQEANLKEGLKSLGIPLKNLSLSDANADYVRVGWFRKDVVAQADYLLKVGDADTVRQVFKKLEELKITTAYVSKVDHSKLKELEKEVRIAAIKDAKEKADYLLAAIGEETGKALWVSASGISNAPHRDAVQIRGGRSSETQYYIDGVKVDGDPTIQYKKIKIEEAVYVKFEIR